MQTRLWLGLALLAWMVVGFAATPVTAADEAAAKKYEQMIDRAVAFLATAQASDGSLNAGAGPAVTALVTTGVLRHGRSPEDPVVAKALKYIEGFIRADGGIHAPETFYKNYETCIAILCLKEANRNGKYDVILKNADAFIKSNQWGSAGEKGRRTWSSGARLWQIAAAGPVEHQLLRRCVASGGQRREQRRTSGQALLFVSRRQNYQSPSNTTKFAGKLNDGGFYYARRRRQQPGGNRRGDRRAAKLRLDDLCRAGRA
jgi:squalene-hopene/tetraprenyl-beta-curcumene cyclase